MSLKSEIIGYHSLSDTTDYLNTPSRTLELNLWDHRPREHGLYFELTASFRDWFGHSVGARVCFSVEEAKELEKQLGKFLGELEAEKAVTT